MSLTDAPSLFHRVITTVLGNLACILVYLDDIFMNSANIMQHLANFNNG